MQNNTDNHIVGLLKPAYLMEYITIFGDEVNVHLRDIRTFLDTKVEMLSLSKLIEESKENAYDYRFQHNLRIKYRLLGTSIFMELPGVKNSNLSSSMGLIYIAEDHTFHLYDPRKDIQNYVYKKVSENLINCSKMEYWLANYGYNTMNIMDVARDGNKLIFSLEHNDIRRHDVDIELIYLEEMVFHYFEYGKMTLRARLNSVLKSTDVEGKDRIFLFRKKDQGIIFGLYSYYEPSYYNLNGTTLIISAAVAYHYQDLDPAKFDTKIIDI